MNNQLRNALFALFAISGFSGLIYESIWTHYLKLFLGHAAYAQTLVLAIFMGGMAIGSWICSKYSSLWKNLLVGYAAVEGIVGLFAVVFHNAFDSIITYSYNIVLPALNSPTLISIFKWTLSAFFILPESILLGMTFPLMSAGIIRIFPKEPGKSISMLYFANSIGAAIGVLTSGFLLIKLVGLPGTIRIAGIINIALAITVWLLINGKNIGQPGPVSDKNNVPDYPSDNSRLYLSLLSVSLITGTSSFIYEIGWIRMLSFVLSSSTHAFELMLSAFIFGLALGGLWIKNRIDKVTNPIRFLIHVQIAMGILAIATIPVYENTFYVMQWLVTSIKKTDAGYMSYNLSRHFIALAVMLPATFCAGMTLPLITYTLIKNGHGEKSIGAVYATNTIGAIIGVFFSIHFGMPLLGLKGLITLGASLDMALGLFLMWFIVERWGSKFQYTAITLLCVFSVSISLLIFTLDPYKMASGVYRSSRLLSPMTSTLIYHKDGKTATISVALFGDNHMSIRTNGKPDATINMTPYGKSHPDEATMVLAAAIPMSIHPNARLVANIGLGSGLTTHTLLTNPLLRQVDTIEIEEEIVRGAKNFDGFVELFYRDPRSKIYIDDAKTFFSSNNKKYDIIISEPSNPWVSGIASLFSKEFYHLINKYLNESGLFVQWFHLPETNTDLVASVFKAITPNFSDYVIYAANYGDILIIAKKGGIITSPDSFLFNFPLSAKALQKIGIESIQDIELHKIGDKKILLPILMTSPIRSNSDYYPVLDQNASRAMFLRETAYELFDFYKEPLPIIEMLSQANTFRATNITPNDSFPKTHAAYTAMALRDYLITGMFPAKYSTIPADIRQEAEQFRHIMNDCGHIQDKMERMRIVFNIMKNIAPFLSKNEMEGIWNQIETKGCTSNFSVEEKQWLSLFKAIGRRDAYTMANTAKTLLENGNISSQNRARYLLASGMLGFLAQGNKEASFQLWYDFQATALGTGQPSSLFRMLKAHSTTK